MFKITEDLIYVGVDDEELKLFEGQYPVPNGVSYNSYICFDDKIAVFDTVDRRKTDEWLENIEKALKGSAPDYLIVSHVEPDHSASIPAFLQKYPSTAVVGNEKTFALIKRFYGDIIDKKVTVKEGDALSLGKHALTFIFAPMVHWPEVMMTYDKRDGILFSADGFGKFGALAHGEEWLDEARRYYVNIVGKFGNSVQNVLKKAAGLTVNAICPLHGPVLKSDINYYISKYLTWSSYAPEEDGVLVAYASVYGNTATAAEALACELNRRGFKAETVDLNKCDRSFAVATAFKYSKLVVASITYDGGIMPAAEAFINRLKAKNYGGRTVAFIENGSWAPVAAKLMRGAFETMKSITFAQTTVTVNSAPDEISRAKIVELADELARN